MGLTSKKLIVKKSYESEKSVEISFLVDSGAVYSLVPGRFLDDLGIKPHRKVDFSLADGTLISRRVGDAYFELNGEGGAAPVIYGEIGDDPLLGATTLESLGLVLNPFTRELYPMRMLMAKIRPAG
jgi:clan AA aspartic protease